MSHKSDDAISKNTSGVSGVDNKHIFGSGKNDPDARAEGGKGPLSPEVIDELKQDTKGTSSPGSAVSQQGHSQTIGDDDDTERRARFR
jgi:hypothetical protein